MLTKPELLRLIAAPESSRVEKTAPTTDKDKFGEAVCAFANDMADTGLPGYLLVGVRDDGSLSGLKATDALLQKFASIRSEGNVLPIPTLAVESFGLPGGDVIVVEVQPSAQPPVRYRGRTWIRLGPRRDIATLAEETALAERKARLFATFDARPCTGATLEDLDLDPFRHEYLPKAVAPEVLAADDRPVERQMEALHLYNSAYGCPTYAAVLLFGRDPAYFLPGAYLQYVQFDGFDNAAPIVNEHAYNRGIATLQKELAANGNGPARFSFRLRTAFEATVALANPRGEEAVAPENGCVAPKTESVALKDGPVALKTESVAAEMGGVAVEKPPVAVEINFDLVDKSIRISVSDMLTTRKSSVREAVVEKCMRVYVALRGDNTASKSALSAKLAFPTRTIDRCIAILRQAHLVEHVGPKKGGRWTFPK